MALALPKRSKRSFHEREPQSPRGETRRTGLLAAILNPTSLTTSATAIAASVFCPVAVPLFGSAIAPVSVRTTILDANDRAVRDQLLTLTPKDFTNRRAALALDIGQRPPEDYVLTLDASLERHKSSRLLHFAVQ